MARNVMELRPSWRRFASAAGLCLVAALSCGAARAAGSGLAVDLELVLAVDISYSMDAEEQQVQRDGYAEAIVSKPVLDAVSQGMLGRIAVVYVEWAGADEQRVVTGWTVVDGRSSAEAFARKLQTAPLRRAYRTSISGALLYSSRLFDQNGFAGARQVIDISGDGPNNQGEAMESVRNRLVSRGLTINGLPLMMKRPTFQVMDVGDLDAYYRDCVIGGPGAFMLPVRAIEQFKDAVRTKLLLEIAGLAPDVSPLPAGEPRATPAAARRKPAATDCLGGEQLWRERFGQ